MLIPRLQTWKSVYLVLRPNTLAVYKTEKEDRLRHQVYLSDLTAIAFLKDPKNKRQNVFGLFSPSKNFHFEAASAKEADSWVALIRKGARIEEEEEEMFLASPKARRQMPGGLHAIPSNQASASHDYDRTLSSSPEPIGPLANHFAPDSRRKSSNIESSGLSGNELASDFSDNDISRLPGTSFESLAMQSPVLEARQPGKGGNALGRSLSQMSGGLLEQDPDRIIWQGWLWFLRTKGGVKQWKHLWSVLRPRNLIMYKNESEYTAQHIISLSAIVNVVDIDPQSKRKANCLQIITEEKSYRMCAHDEEALVQCIGAFKSLLAKRRELEARQAASTGPPATAHTQEQDR